MRQLELGSTAVPDAALRPALLLLSRDWRDAEPVRRCLATEGYDVTLAISPREALTLLGSRHYDAVLTEADLGVESGFDVLADIRRQFPGVWRMLVAGSECVQEMVTAMGRGTIHFCVARPVDRSMLLSTVRHALSGRCSD